MDDGNRLIALASEKLRYGASRKASKFVLPGRELGRLLPEGSNDADSLGLELFIADGRIVGGSDGRPLGARLDSADGFMLQ